MRGMTPGRTTGSAFGCRLQWPSRANLAVPGRYGMSMADPRDSVSWVNQSEAPRAEEKSEAADGTKPFLRLWFECSGQYARAYRAADGCVYVGRCPKCGAAARFPIAEGGTAERFFRVSCA